MISNDLLSPHQVKTIEYLLAVGYLLLFVPFWRFVNGTSLPARLPARAGVRRSADWFLVPAWLHFHPGHMWARRDPRGLATVGLDDFACKLVGPLDSLELPPIGSSVRQGEPALRLESAGRSVAMLAPIDGTVVSVNQEALARPDAALSDPYDRGWLFRVKPEHWATSAKQLLSGGIARRWMEGVAEMLGRELHPDLGVALQDGGQPVNGIARELRGDRWNEFARTYLLS